MMQLAIDQLRGGRMSSVPIWNFARFENSVSGLNDGRTIRQFRIEGRAGLFTTKSGMPWELEISLARTTPGNSFSSVSSHHSYCSLHNKFCAGKISLVGGQPQTADGSIC
jgi:hypothetical protein